MKTMLRMEMVGESWLGMDVWMMIWQWPFGCSYAYALLSYEFVNLVVQYENFVFWVCESSVFWICESCGGRKLQVVEEGKTNLNEFC